MRIAIIGAGIGGLVTAAALHRTGHAVTILEKRPQPGAIGAGLSLFGNSFAALESVGLGDVIAPLITAPESPLRAGQRTTDGRWLVTLPRKATNSMRVLHRIDLHSALADCLEPGTLHSGCDATVTSIGQVNTELGVPGAGRAVSNKPGMPEVTISSTIEGEAADPIAGSSATFDLVVAADGIRSSTRTAMGLDTGVRYAGYTAWRGVTDQPVNVHAEAGETWGLGRRFGIAPLPDGRVYWFATENSTEKTTHEDEKAAILSRFGSWHDPIRTLLESTETRAISRHDIYDLASPLESFVKGRVVLVGDAAHAMTPDLGQGAGQAIEDAATLALLLKGTRTGSDIDAALRVYDRTRRARSQWVARKSRAMGKLAQCDSPTRASLRDTVLRMTPNTFVGAAASRLQRWQPPRGT
ncbi:MAG: FAD-dependent monooxygenase [Terrimesophilobacter sp.]